MPRERVSCPALRCVSNESGCKGTLIEGIASRQNAVLGGGLHTVISQAIANATHSVQGACSSVYRKRQNILIFNLAMQGSGRFSTHALHCRSIRDERGAREGGSLGRQAAQLAVCA